MKMNQLKINSLKMICASGSSAIGVRRLITLALFLIIGICSTFQRSGIATSQADDLRAAIRLLEMESGSLERGANFEPHLRAISARLEREAVVAVIVRLRTPFSPRIEVAGGLPAMAQRQVVDATRARLLASLPLRDPGSLKTWPLLPFVAMRIDRAGLDALRASAEVLDIEEDQLNFPQLSDSTKRIGAVAAQAAGYDGTGQTVAVLDTGIDSNHPFLQGKVTAEACFSTDIPSESFVSLCADRRLAARGPGTGAPCDENIPECSHGTALAGIIAGKGSSFSGVAPGSNLISIKIYTKLEGERSCGPNSPACIGAFDSDLISGLLEVYSLQQRHRIAAVNLATSRNSFNRASCDESNQNLKLAIDLLAGVDIPVITAAGNSGNAGSLMTPACISSAVSVGSTGIKGDQEVVSSFSNHSIFLNLLAPGEAVVSSTLGGGFKSESGTSTATAHVSGAWALLRQKQPTARPIEILTALTRTGKRVFDPVIGIELPRIQVDDALRELDQIVSPYLTPINLSAVYLQSGRIDLRWADRSTNETGFRIRRRVIGKQDWRDIGTVGAGQTNFVDANLVESGLYVYQVIAIFTGGESLPSHQVSLVVSTPIPQTPFDIQAQPLSTYRVDLAWSVETQPTDSIYIQRVNLKTFYPNLFVQVGTSKGFSDTLLTPGVRYQYTVVIAGSGGTYRLSNPVIVTTPLTDIAVTTDAGGAMLDFGRVTPGSDPATPVIKQSLRIRNISKIGIGLNLRTARPATSGRPYFGVDYLNFPYTVSNGSGTLVQSGPDPYKLELEPDEERQITISFDRSIPAPTIIPVTTRPLSLLPPIVEADFLIEPVDRSKVDRPAIRMIGRVETRARLINPTETSLPPTVQFNRDGNGITVAFSLFDPNLDTSLVTYQFYDQIGRPVGKLISYYPGPFLRSETVLPGMSVNIDRRFTGLERFADVRSVRVTIFDPEGSDSTRSIPVLDPGSAGPK